DGRRCDLGILRNGQAHVGDRAEDHEHDRHHRSEDRPVDEKMRDLHWITSASAAGRLARTRAYVHSDLVVRASAEGCPGPTAGAPSSCGVTFCPGRARIRPLTMTRSSAASPSLTTRIDPTAWPKVTNFCCTVPSGATTSRNLRACSVPIATSGTNSAR